MSRLRIRLRTLPLGLLVFLVACTVNPAGRTVFTGFMSPGAEAELGAKEHPKVIQEFGGEYDHLARVSEWSTAEPGDGDGE